MSVYCVCLYQTIFDIQHTHTRETIDKLCVFVCLSVCAHDVYLIHITIMLMMMMILSFFFHWYE